MTKMNLETVNKPRILVVDDERQIHASLRLRLGKDYELTYCLEASSALKMIQNERFDLCFADIHMPHIDGFAFIEAARDIDPHLGYVLLSAFDTDENLRRTIPLHVYDFLPKPLPEKADFEGRIPEWVMLTRRLRRERELTTNALQLADDREAARLERDVEFVASETARDALLQTAGLLTTIHAQLVSAFAILESRAKTDQSLTFPALTIGEARKTAAAAMTVASGFFNSAYGNRDSSPALVNSGIRHAIGIAKRLACAEESSKDVDFTSPEDHSSIRGLSGIDFLLMLVPAISAALVAASPKTTIGIHRDYFSRLDCVPKEPRLREYLWINRRNAFGSQPCTLISLKANSAPLTRGEIENWLRGEHAPLSNITTRGLISGIQIAHGLMGIALCPGADRFCVVLALPSERMVP